MPGINGLPGVRTMIRQGTNVNLKPPTLLTSSFTVDTILGQLNWTDTNGGKAQYEVYSSTNLGVDVLLGTTIAGATSYQDLTCKQNASISYKLKAKIGSRTSEFVPSTSLLTPLCWKTNQSVLTAVTIQNLTLSSGTVNINWGDGTNANYSGANAGIVKNYSVAGQYNINISGNINNITAFYHFNQIKSFGNLTNWILPASLVDFQFNGSTGLTGVVTNWVIPSSLSICSINSTALTGIISNWVLPSSLTVLFLNSTGISGTIPNIGAHATNGLNLQANAVNISDSNTTTFRKAMTQYSIANQNVVFSTANINKLLKALADWYQVNAPTANCTINMSGANMGIPTGGSSNADLVRLVGYYTAAGESCTVLCRTS